MRDKAEREMTFQQPERAKDGKKGSERDFCRKLVERPFVDGKVRSVVARSGDSA
jgi:hypothetical protein